MELKISKGNKKIGGVPNFSLTPGVSCVPNIPCFTEGCYAKKALMYPATRRAWASNLDLYLQYPFKFFRDLHEWLAINKPERFRAFVGGDFPNEDFWIKFAEVVNRHPETSFLAFTKRYDYDYSIKPDNCQIILSTWPGVPLPENEDLPWAWLEEDIRFPLGSMYLKCQGNCSGSCNYKCWSLIDKDIPVIFPKH